MNQLNARQIAWHILIKVIVKKKFPNDLLNEVAKFNLAQKDKNLIFNLVHGTLKYKINLEYLTSTKLITPAKTRKEIQILLWMSLYQMRFLQNIPNYAIVNEAVEICKKNFPNFKNLVNACLNKVVRLEAEFFVINLKNDQLAFCLRNAYPYELFKILVLDYSLEIAIKIVEDSLKTPLISFRVNTLKISETDFLVKYSEQFSIQKHQFENCYTTSYPIVNEQIYQDGLIMIQDPASILVTNVLNPTLQTQVMDMCSAPGGKLTHMSALMKNTGHIDAYEIVANKLTKINDNIKRLGVQNTTINCMDATTIVCDQKYDYILLDAPCSGLGVFKRKADIKITQTNFDFSALVKLQAKLLKVAYQALKPNGFLVYSTCTINKKENSLQTQNFLKDFPNMTLIFEQQLFGFESETDGFYIVKYQKRNLH